MSDRTKEMEQLSELAKLVGKQFDEVVAERDQLRVQIEALQNQCKRDYNETCAALQWACTTNRTINRLAPSGHVKGVVELVYDLRREICELKDRLESARSALSHEDPEMVSCSADRADVIIHEQGTGCPGAPVYVRTDTLMYLQWAAKAVFKARARLRGEGS